MGEIVGLASMLCVKHDCSPRAVYAEHLDELKGLMRQGASKKAAEKIRAHNLPDLGWFTDARFGIFIHWGPVSLKGTEIGWSRGKQVPAEEYDELHTQFNPEKFNAEDWVKTAKAAGMKYLVITAKHHDGFCLWDSKLTDYDIMNTPFGRDVLAELSAACKKHDLRFCVYYSICDWRHPEYPTGSPGGRTVKPDADIDRYIPYLHGQLEEIVTNYGPVGRDVVRWRMGEAVDDRARRCALCTREVPAAGHHHQQPREQGPARHGGHDPAGHRQPRRLRHARTADRLVQTAPGRGRRA